MNVGKPFEDFVTTIERNAAHREDVVARLNTCRMASDASGSVWTINGVGEYESTPVFHRSVAETLKIPTSYYADMQATYPALLDANINSWLKAEQDRETRLMRLFDASLTGTGRGVARAIRSTSFLPLDNDELLTQLRPVLDESGVTVQSCDIGERRTYIKITTPRLKGDVRVGDTVEAGIVVSNSEVGYGNISVAPFVLRLVCTNGLTTLNGSDEAIRRIHRGSTIHCFQPFIHLSDNNERKAAKAAIWAAVSEAVGVALQQTSFRELLERLQAAHKAKLSAKTNSEKLFDRIGKDFGLTDAERTAAIHHFETDNERSLWGMANAITRIANDAGDYERSSALEQIGGRIIQLPEKEWRQLTELN